MTGLKLDAFALAFLLLSWLPALASGTSRLHTLTTAFEVHNLTTAEALRGYPIHITGVVTYFDSTIDSRQVAIFVHDATGSIFVGMPQDSIAEIPAGSRVDLQGVSGMGDFAPIVARGRIRVLGSGSLPTQATSVSLTRLLTGSVDGQWVEVEGVVHSVFESGHQVVLQIAMRDGLISGNMPRQPGLDYQFLVDARVKIDANAAPLFNGNGQMIGARLLITSLSTVHVIEPGPGNVFRLPTRTIDSLSRFNPVASLPRRVHVRGRVTLIWPGSLLCIRDATHGLCAHTLQRTPIKLGDLADVAGFAQSASSSPSLSDAIFEKYKGGMAAGSDGVADAQPPAAVRVTADQALNGNHDSELVQMEGQLMGRDLTTADTTLLLASEGVVYAALLPASQANATSRGWKNGSRLRITGICSVELDALRTEREGGVAKRKSFRVLLRSPDDVVVLQQGSWWTPAHTAAVLMAVLTMTLLVLGWVVVLSRRLKQQTRLIRKSEEEFRHLAQHDALTGLPTRLLLRDRLDHALEIAKRSGTGVALLMLDLDNFKLINDSLGHQAGDQALKISAGRLIAAVRGSDTVARISGDEFIVLIANLNEAQEAEMVAAKIVAALAAPFHFGDREVPLSASVGVCTAASPGLDANALLKCADAAMYHAKARGRNCFQLYTADMARYAEDNLRLRAGLRHALPANELEVHYQPMVSFKTGELTGFEALLRWRSEEMGSIAPGDFIPVAEQTGLIIPIGEWVLREACHDIGKLEKKLGRSFMVSVNLSPRQIQNQPNLSESLARVLADLGRPPDRVEFEITENMLMSDSAVLQASLTRMRDLGVRLAIDDFGMGFSSLSYITRFSIDRIKIDRSFIRKCTREGGNLAVVRAMIAMAHGLSMDVVAEGIETAAEFSFLRQEGCDTAQGFYLSRPVPASELLELVPMVDELLQIQADDFQVGS